MKEKITGGTHRTFSHTSFFKIFCCIMKKVLLEFTVIFTSLKKTAVRSPSGPLYTSLTSRIKALTGLPQARPVYA